MSGLPETRLRELLAAARDGSLSTSHPKVWEVLELVSGGLIDRESGRLLTAGERWLDERGY